MSAISASFRGLSQQSHLLRGWSFTLIGHSVQFNGVMAKYTAIACIRLGHFIWGCKPKRWSFCGWSSRITELHSVLLIFVHGVPLRATF